MATFSKRDLNQQTSRVLAAVEAEGPVTVTERGTPRWRIEAVAALSAPVDRLRAEGRIIPAKTDAAAWVGAGESRPGAEIDALLDELRGDSSL